MLIKALVLGSNGQLGQSLRDQFVNTDYEVIFTSREQIDITDFEAAKASILDIMPVIVINATAYTSVDRAEEQINEADLINHLAVENLASICGEIDSWLVHVSTDYVFDGEAFMPYLEDDQTAPKGVYGQTKLDGELAIQSSNCKYIIIRTAWIFSEYGNNFLKTMLRLGSDHDDLSIVGDQVGCPTYAQDLAACIVDILPLITARSIFSDVYHYCGDQPCSWFEFANEIFVKARSFGFCVPSNLKSIPSSDYQTVASRPKYSVLDCSKINRKLGISCCNWQAGVTKSLEKLALE